NVPESLCFSIYKHSYETSRLTWVLKYNSKNILRRWVLMKITLAFPHTLESERLGARSFPPTAIYYLGAILRNNGHAVRVFDPQWPNNYDDNFIRDAIDGCDLLGLSANVINWRFAKHFASLVKSQRKDLKIVIGGVYANIVKVLDIDNPPWDFIIRGEGEETLIELVNSIDGSCRYDNILGLSYIDESGVIHNNADRPLLTKKELSNQPLPAFDLLPNKKYLALGLESSRGCSYNCKFCSIQYRNKFRSIAQQIFLDKIAAVYDLGHEKVNTPNHNKVPIMLLDDCFTTEQQRAINILKGLAKYKEKIRFGIEARADQLSEEIAEALKENSLFIIQIGMESGYQDGLNKIGKHLKIEDIKKACAVLKKNDLAKIASCSFILGFPWETKDDCLKTLRFAEDLNLKYEVNVGLSWYELYPGSVIWEKKAKWKINVDLQSYNDFFYDFRNDINFFKKVHPILNTKDIDEIEDHVFEISKVSTRVLTNFPYMQRERNICSLPF
ncbi:MAG: radical SAM protein, partial [Minisyncoccia bacterium]